MAFPSILFGPESERFNTYVQPIFPLGTRLKLQGGREFRFGRNGGVAAAPGRMFQSEVPDGDHDTLAVPTSTTNTVGSRSLTVTNGADIVEANLYAEGYAVTEAVAGSGEGYAYKWPRSHGELAASVAVVVPLEAGNGLAVALTAAADTVTLVKHPMADVVIATAPPAAAVVGVAANTMAASTSTVPVYGWFQIRGPCACLISGTMVIGGSVSPCGTAGPSTAGAVESSGIVMTAVDPTIAEYTENVPVGICMEMAPTGDFGLVLLNMA